MIAFWGPQQLTYPNGRTAAREAVLVVVRDGSAQVPTFTEASGSIARPQPLYTDMLGNLGFYAEQGAYDLFVNNARIPIDVAPSESQGGSNYTHTQSTPAATWVINHHLGRFPDLVFALSDDPTRLVQTDVVHVDLNTATVEFPTAVSGYAYT